MTVLQAYIDDSASDKGDQRLFLAGYINTAEKWARFSDAWEEELRLAPSIKYLKMSEANSLSGEFSGWSIPDKDKKIQALSRVIRHFGPASIHASVSRLDVKSIIEPVAPYGFSSPYFYVFQSIMLPLAIHQSKQNRLIGVPIDFIFDNQEALGDEAKSLYKAIREVQPRKIKSLLSVDPQFKDDKLAMPLQAADILAWHVRRHAERGDPNTFMVPDFLSHDGKHMAVDISADDLRRIADGLAAIPGSALLRKKAIWKRNRRELDQQLAQGFIPPRGTRWKNAVYYTREFLTRFFQF